MRCIVRMHAPGAGKARTCYFEAYVRLHVFGPVFVSNTGTECTVLAMCRVRCGGFVPL